MGTIVCQQGLQPCLESQMVESRTLRLRLSAPKPTTTTTHSLELSLKPSIESGGWSFLQALSDPTSSSSSSSVLKPVSASSYPYKVKRSVSSLSDKSLQLCTENLGSETGTDHVAADRSLFISPSSWELPQSEPSSPASESPPAVSNYKRSRTSAKRGSGGFPPPLTTMRGPELVQVRRPHREGGRLVIEAVKSQSQPSCFEAERIDGRLRLHVAVTVKDSSEFVVDSSVTASEGIAEEGNGEEAEAAEEGEILIRQGEGEEEEEEEEEITERKININNNINNSRNSNANTAWRCKEEGAQFHHHHEKNISNSNNGLFNWEPFWVATASLQV